MDFFQEYVNKLDSLDIINILSTSVVNAPTDTKGGIISTMMQKLSLIVIRPNILEHLNKEDNIELKNENQAIFIKMSEIGDSFPNLLCEIILNNLIKKLYKQNIPYNIAFINYDDLVNKEYYEKVFKTYNRHNINCLVNTTNISNIKRIESFKLD